MVMLGYEPLCIRLLDYKKASLITPPPRAAYYTRAISYIPFACARHIKNARLLHDPGTGYWLIYVHYGSCTLQLVDLTAFLCIVHLFTCLGNDIIGKRSCILLQTS